MNRIDRLFGILLLLRRKARIRAQNLAASFEVSERTIYRDMLALQELGVPIISLPGAGYELGPGFYLPPLLFSADEASAALLGAKLIAAQTQGRLVGAAEQLAAKVAAILLERERQRRPAPRQRQGRAACQNMVSSSLRRPPGRAKGRSMKYRLVIFDFDGTLADSFPFFLSVINQLADRHRFKRVDLETVDSLRVYSSRELMRGARIPFWRMPLIARDFRRLMGAQIGQIPRFPGVDELLPRLAQAGIRLAVVTSNSYANVRQVLGPANAALIDDYECGVAIFGKQGKFRKVLRRSGLRPEQALCIGDEIRDAEAARHERLPFGAVAWGYTALEALMACGPAEVFSSVDEIAARLLTPAG